MVDIVIAKDVGINVIGGDIISMKVVVEPAAAGPVVAIICRKWPFHDWHRTWAWNPSSTRHSCRPVRLIKAEDTSDPESDHLETAADIRGNR